MKEGVDMNGRNLRAFTHRFAAAYTETKAAEDERKGVNTFM